MLKIQIFFLLGLLAAASSISPTLKKRFFFMKDALAMSNQLFQTRNGIISYLIEEDSDDAHLHSSYLLIDLETKNLTQILSSLPESCGQEISIFNKLHYHAATYSLIYYCSNNNTLIILDEDDYNVQQTIPLNVTETFQEVRMTTDGYSIAILGLIGLLNTNPAPTHLFKVSMLSRKVLNHVIFDHSLNSGEAVTAYASNGNGFYVLTNTINGPSPLLDNMTIYSMTLIANSYKLTQLANFSATIAGYNVVNELYCVENLIVTNNYLSVIIMNDEGSILQEIQGLGIEAQTEGIFNLVQPQLLSEYGSSDFYALWDNSTISKFSAHKQGYTSEFIGLGVSFQIAAKDQDSNSLLFTINRNYSVDSFTITDLNTLETVYQALMNPTQVMLTPVTYCQAFIGARGMQFFIFDLQTDALLTHLSTGTRNAWYYYYDQENYIFFYLELVQSDLSFQLVQIDFQTGNTYNVSTNLTSDSQPALIHATNKANFNALQFVISTQTAEEYKYLIMSQAYGEIVAFTPPNSSEVSTLIVNYDTLSVYHFYSTYAVMAEMYSYDSATKNFTLEKSVNYTNNTGFYQSISFGPGHAVVYSEGYISIGVIDVQSLELVTYSVPFSWMTISIFQGSSNGIRFILSANGTSPATLFDNGTVQPLPESANYTVLREAGVAGVCSYWVENEIPQNVVVLDIFDICSEESVYNSIISI